MSSPLKVEFGRVVRAVITEVMVRRATVSGVVYDTAPADIPVRALWDTGAGMSVISTKIVEKLALSSAGNGTLVGIGGAMPTELYDISVTLPNKKKSFRGGFLRLFNLHRIEIAFHIVFVEPNVQEIRFFQPTTGVKDHFPRFIEAEIPARAGTACCGAVKLEIEANICTLGVQTWGRSISPIRTSRSITGRVHII